MTNLQDWERSLRWYFPRWLFRILAPWITGYSREYLRREVGE